MNTQERDELARFLQQLTQAQITQKDSEAESLIRDACSRQPDAAYLLVQRSLILDQALQNAQAQTSRLQGELDHMRSQTRAGSGSGGFLDPNAWGNSPVTQPGVISQAAATPTTPRLFAPQTGAPAPSSWGSGMLGNIATTAAGVVAGGFLFQGIGHLLGNHGSSPTSMNGLRSNETADYSETTTINPAVGNEAVGNDDSSDGLFDTSSVDSFVGSDGDSSI